ncbi:MAG: gliding motility-associated C-terminal domain-containing protein [Chitinophagaceae bacterium]|nr:gliding motility-associated C-terminal domain-containing protein [Chitinophagaceae bacterium]
MRFFHPVRHIFLTLFLFTQISVWGGQFMGGEISYRFINRSGNEFTYELTFKIYRECFNPADLDDPIIRLINSTDLTRNIHPIIYREITLNSPVITYLPYSYKDYCVINDPPHCIELLTYTTQIGLPFSPEGYTFYYTGCCRNGLTNLVSDAGNGGAEYVNTIPVPGQALTYVTYIPSHDSIMQNSNPVSVNDSIVYACKGKPFTYQFRFFDADGDSLVIKPTSSLMKVNAATTNFFSLFFKTGYSSNSPMGSTITINEEGVLSGTPGIEGFFAMALIIEEYRNGVLINKSRKDYQVNIATCEIKKPPEIINCDDNIATFFQSNNATNLYHWDFGVPVINSDTSNDMQPIYLYPQNGTFQVKLLATNPSGGCKDSVFTTAKIYPDGLQVDFDWNGQTCAGHPLTFVDRTTSTAGAVAQNWTWHILNNNTTIGNTPSVTYTHAVSGTMPYPLAVRLVVQTDLWCKDSLVKDILIYENVYADAGPDRILPFGQVYQMQGNSTASGVNYIWSPSFGLSDPFIRHPEVRADRDIEYILEVNNETGCFDRDTVKFRYMKGPDIYVATAFTPNNDGINDILNFFPVGMGFARLSIYNRWGQMIFSTTDINKGWDGKVKGVLQDTGVYTWMVKAKNYEGNAVIRKGTVLLIR